MRNRLWRCNFWICVLTAIIILGFSGITSVGMCDEYSHDPRKTGLRAPTPEELVWQNKHMTRVKKVKLNNLGLERINQWRKQSGLTPLTEDEAGVVETGNEIEGETGDTLSGEVAGGEYPQAGLPPYVDNSALLYFPPIRSQGSIGSCACFSSTYYTMTYMYSWIHEIDAKNGTDHNRFSPKWTYNMINGGEDSGSWFSGAFNIALKHGPATWAEFPYDANYREWCLNKNVWRNAIDRRFDRTGYVSDLRQDSGVQSLKEMLNNGYILNFATYVNSWQWTTIKNDPATSADDAFAGKPVAFWVNGTSGGHGMTVVGYNDDIWVDINGNETVDPGEKGAFRIANSWGTGWREGGFSWFAYDGLKSVSAVPGGPSVNRREGWWYGQAYWITPRNYAYQPLVVAEFTLNHLKRNQLRLSLGISDTTRLTPATAWTPAMIYAQGGPYAFNGTTSAVDGTFVFDFTDILPGGLNNTMRYYLGIYDGTTGDSARLLSYELIDAATGDIVTRFYDVPMSVDARQAYAYVDYYYDDDNLRPVALVYADPVAGQAPLTVNFDGAGSSDPDGTIVSYSWNYGDGATGSGATSAHQYLSAGNYTATLTVKDNNGATHSDTVLIDVWPPPPKAMYVSDIAMSLVSRGTNTSAQATVYIVDEDGAPVAGATVSGTWSGLVGGSVSGVTGGNGTVSLSSANTKSTGTFTITVNNVSASGYDYDPGRNIKTSASISNGVSPNQKPVANAGVDQSVDVGNAVILDGSGSYDPDGTIASWHWNFGDGATATGEVVSHVYATAGTYTAALTVTDDKGATDTDTVIVAVTDGSVTDMVVSGIVMTPAIKGVNGEMNVAVTVLDENNQPVANAAVTALWGGLFSGSVSGLTGSDGTAYFLSPKTKNRGLVTFTITGVTASGYAYDAAGSMTSMSENL